MYSKNVYLQRCKVVMSSNFNSKLTGILLNNGSQHTCLFESLVHALNLKPISQEILSVYSFRMQSTVENMYSIAEIEIKSLDQSFKTNVQTLVVLQIIGDRKYKSSEQTREFTNNQTENS